MRHRLALPLLILVLLAAGVPYAPARADTQIVPLGPAQAVLRAAYTALFDHIGVDKRARWAQRSFDYDSATYAPGTVVAPDGIAGSGYDSLVISSTLAVTLALDALGTRVAVFRSTVSDPSYGSAAWELADVCETLDTYLGGALRYEVLDEVNLANKDLSSYAILVVPSIRRGNEQDMLAALGPLALAKIRAFVEAGGFLYAQSNGAIVAEAAGVVAPGTVNLNRRDPPRPGPVVENQGDVAVGPFWVDFYIDPQPVPTVAGQCWDLSCTIQPCEGIAWLAPGLAPGGRVTLTSAPESFAGPYSIWTGAFRVSGTHDLYVYADSWNGNDPLGSVHEADEANNRAALRVIIDGNTSMSAQPARPRLPERPLPGP